MWVVARRRRPLPPRFVRPQMLPPADELDFGVLVFAPPYPPPPPVASPEPAAEAAVAAADTSQAHGADQSPVARQLLFDGVTRWAGGGAHMQLRLFVWCHSS